MAQYRAGRVTVTLNSETVTGLDTDWVQAVDPGDVFLIRGDEVPYRVASVVSNTSLRLNAKYAGPTQTNATYSITRDFTPNLGLPIIRNGDVDAVPLFAEGLIQIDAKWGTAGGGGNGGGGGGGTSSTLAGLSDVNVTGSIAGDTFTKLPNGSYGFVRPYVFTLAVDHAPGSGGRIIKSYADGSLIARRINVAGGTVTENPDDLTINIPSPGEVNTLATAGTTASQTLVVAKSGTTLRVKGIRASGSITLTPEGNDLVIGSTATGTGTPVTYTMAPIGTGVSLVGTPSGTELRVKTLTFDGNFTVAQPAGAGVTVALNKFPITQISNVAWDTITSGQLLYRNAAGNVAGINMPQTGITAVVQDTAPRLGGPLDVAGNRVIGQPISFSGLLARPKNKSYTICLSAPASMRLTSVVVNTESGTAAFRIDVGGPPTSADPENGAPPSPLQGIARSTVQSISATSQISVDTGESIVMTISAVSVDINDLAFTISGVTF